MKIQVTKPNYDNIGEVLKSMNIQFNAFDSKNFVDSDILFMNCGTEDKIDKGKLKTFVKNGGIFYASDLTSTFVNEVFPDIFEFKGSGNSGTLEAEIVDSRLIEFIGKKISANFDLGSWSKLDKIKSGKVIMKRIDTGKPLMVEVPYGEGKIYYTSFHNHKQASEKEVALLKILVLTQLSELNKKSIEDMADIIDFNLNEYKSKWGENENEQKLNKMEKSTPSMKDFNFDKGDIYEKKKSEGKKTTLEDFDF